MYKYLETIMKIIFLGNLHDKPGHILEPKFSRVPRISLLRNIIENLNHRDLGVNKLRSKQRQA